MPLPADWSRADIIAALALMVSILAFIASAVSSLVSWRSYLAGRAAMKPKVVVYFEPFADSDRWWIANFRFRNRSGHVLRFDSIKILWSPGVAFSEWLGGFAGGGSGGGPMHYDLPTEVESCGHTRKLTKLEDDDLDLEIEPANESDHFAILIVGTPRRQFCRHVRFRLDMIELGERHRRVSFRLSAPYPTKANVKPRF